MREALEVISQGSSGLETYGGMSVAPRADSIIIAKQALAGKGEE